MKDKKLILALIGLLDVFMEGRNYDTMNPHMRPEIKTACHALGCDNLEYREKKAKILKSFKYKKGKG